MSGGTCNLIYSGSRCSRQLEVTHGVIYCPTCDGRECGDCREVSHPGQPNRHSATCATRRPR